MSVSRQENGQSFICVLGDWILHTLYVPTIFLLDLGIVPTAMVFPFTCFSIFQKDNQLDNIIFVLHMNVNGQFALIYILCFVIQAGVAGNIVRPARLSDRTILPRLDRPVGHLILGGIVRVQAIWSGLLSQNVR